MTSASSFRILSVNVGLPQEIKWKGETVLTAIIKKPVDGPARVHRLNVEGDRQADLTVHGGVDKAVYIYPADHYAAWKRELGREDLPWGMFGENLTIEGRFSEDTVCVGDTFLAGTAELMAVRPRMPCRKLGIRFGSQRFVKQFARSGRFGIYCRVIREGTVAAGDLVTFTSRHRAGLTIGDMGSIMLGKKLDRALMERAIGMEELPARLRQQFQDLLEDGPERAPGSQEGNKRFG